MAKYGGTLVAATNSQVATANASRLAVAIQNLDAATALRVEFGAVASTVAADGSWNVPAGGTLTLSQTEFPEIQQTINLKSTGTPVYVVRDNT
jgi:hypothetical protein